MGDQSGYRERMAVEKMLKFLKKSDRDRGPLWYGIYNIYERRTSSFEKPPTKKQVVADS